MTLEKQRNTQNERHRKANILGISIGKPLTYWDVASLARWLERLTGKNGTLLHGYYSVSG